MPRPSKFTRDQLQAAALEIVDQEGLGALSMRTLASSLGTGAMTIYNYVSDRMELEALLVEAVMSKASWDRSEKSDWKEEVKEIALAFWRAARLHPNVIPLILTRRSFSPSFLDPTEALLKALAKSGRRGEEMLIAFRTISGFSMGIAQAELAGPLANQGESKEETISRFQSLSNDKYPSLIEIAKASLSSSPEKEFLTGLNIILKGLNSD
ncbi:TetR/AcrR family transcriptional regulator [Leptospira koniambonensis]|uniref:TetR/AcrR family transcriptional regulator n=1 Tax=Leptospira koniambonensis TaxID=2484950 RepID=UPI003EBA5669